MSVEKRWQVYPGNTSVCQGLSDRLNIHPTIAQVLLNRDLRSLADVKQFMSDYSDFQITPFPEDLLRPVLDIVSNAIKHKKRILLYGDYDVDGITSVSMMMHFLKRCGADVQFFIPSRFIEGYGLHISVVDKILSERIDVLITLDCGVSNVIEIGAIKEKTQAAVIVMDHHTIPDKEPAYDGMLNPKSLDSKHDLYDLCTAGVVYEFMRMYTSQFSIDIDVEGYLDIVALGTIADIAQLKGANRLYTQKGLELLSKRKHLGIRAMLQVAGFDRSQVSPRDVGFVIGPRLNAAGRIAHASLGVSLLLSESEDEATEIAHRLEKLNIERRALDGDILKECMTLVQETITKEDRAVVFAGRGWHAGVIGIAASKLVEKTGRPAVMIADDGSIGRGSARSIGDVSIYYLLKSCEEHFINFGGHKQAAGFSILPEKIPAFQKALREKAKSMLSQEQLRPILTIDAYMKSSDISLDFINGLNKLEPFGQGNAQPLFYTDDLVPVEFRTVGDGSHVKASFRSKTGPLVIDGIGFNLSDKMGLLNKSEVSLAFHLGLNEWQGRVQVQLQLVDIK